MHSNDPCTWATFFHGVSKWIFKIYHRSKSTNVKFCNMHHILLSIHKTYTNTKNLTDYLLPICKSKNNIVAKRRNPNKNASKKTSRCNDNEKIMNPRYKIKICYTVIHNIRNTNFSIKMVFSNKLIIISCKQNQNMYKKGNTKKLQT